MNADEAKKQLERMLDQFTVGSVLHLLADIYGEWAEEARRDNDEMAYQQYKLVEGTLVVVGMGLDAACPR